jgi:hypothetical protein
VPETELRVDGLLQQLHLSTGFFHEGDAFGLGCVKQVLFGIPPVVLAPERNHEDIAGCGEGLVVVREM